MDAAELFGRTLRVNQSQSRIGGGNKRESGWADGDAWNERAAEADAEVDAAGTAFKRQEVVGGGGGGASGEGEEGAARERRKNAKHDDPMAAAEAALVG